MASEAKHSDGHTHGHALATEATTPVVPPSFSTNIRLLTVNDVYTFAPVDGSGGYSQLSTLLKTHRTGNSIFTVNGDFMGGSVLGVRFKGAPAIDVLNYLEPDAVVIGNHEFDYGTTISIY